MRSSILSAFLFTSALAGCSADAHREVASSSSSATPSSIVAALRARPELAWKRTASVWQRTADRLTPSFDGARGAFRVVGEDQLVVDMPAHANGAMRLSYRALPDFWIELVPQGVAPIDGEVVEDAVVFAGVSTATDLVHVARARAVEELRVLRRPEASRVLRWSVRKGPGVASMRVEDDGSIVATHVSGTARFVAPRPFAIDDASADVPLAVRVDDASLEITVDAARARFPVVVDPQWATTGTMATARVLHQATLLKDGRVLITGGSPGYLRDSYDTTEIFDETTGTFTPGPKMASRRAGHTATLLLDGRVLVAGGYLGPSGSTTYLSTTEIFDPTTNTFSAGPAMPGPRGHHAAVRTDSGHVAFVGGRKDETNTGTLTSGLDFNPTTSLFRTSCCGSMQNSGRYWVGATLFGASTVMVAGGFTAASGYVTSVDVFSPEYDMGAFWGSGAAMGSQRAQFDLVRTKAGDVLATGGGGGATAEIYRAASSKWESAGASASAHNSSTSTMLDDGRILVVGGPATADIYDPLAPGAVIAWKPAGSMSAARMWHRAVKLNSGRVLIVGGYTPASVAIATAEIFTTLPQGAACAEAGECATGFCADGICCDKACDGQCEACDLAKKGTCGNVVGPPHGTRTKCGGAASCVDDVAIGEPVCDGSGSCAAPAPTSCLPFKCSAGACKTSCTSNADCSGANVCFEGSCAARQGVCSPDRTSTTLSGQTTPTPCGAYLCSEATGTCGTACTATSDCAGGNACDVASGKCIPAAGDSEDSGGCDLGHSGNIGGGVGLALFALCVAVGRRQTIRRRALTAPRT